MISRDAIKNVILFGGTIEFPYKKKINEWYGKVSICSLDQGYYVFPYGFTFSSCDIAIEYLLSVILSPDNAAYVIDRLSKKGIVCDLESPDDEYIKKFNIERRIVKKEFINLAINVPKEGTADEIDESLSEIIERVETDEYPASLRKDLESFRNTYALNSPHISISFVYSLASQESPYSNGIELKELTRERLRSAKNIELFDESAGAKYLHTELHVSYYTERGGPKIYKLFTLNI
jgi:hypothetical protein